MASLQIEYQVSTDLRNSTLTFYSVVSVTYITFRFYDNVSCKFVLSIDPVMELICGVPMKFDNLHP